MECDACIFRLKCEAAVFSESVSVSQNPHYVTFQNGIFSDAPPFYETVLFVMRNMGVIRDHVSSNAAVP